MKKKKIIIIALSVICVLSLSFFVLKDVLDLKSGGYSDDSYISQNLVSFKEDSFAPQAAGSSSNGASVDNVSQMLIRKASIDITVEDAEKAKEAICSTVSSMGGYISYVSTTNYSDYRYYYLTVCVPSERVQEIPALLDGLGKVTSFNETAYDVKDQYQDNALRIEMYENKLAKLYEFEAKTSDVKTLLEIEDEITETIYHIESLKGENMNLEKESSYATYSINLSEEHRDYSVKSNSLIEIIREAVSDSANVFLDIMEVFIRLVIILFPYALIIAVTVMLVRKIKKSRKTGNDQ